MRGFPTSHLRASSDAVECNRGQRQVGPQPAYHCTTGVPLTPSEFPLSPKRDFRGNRTRDLNKPNPDSNPDADIPEAPAHRRVLLLTMPPTCRLRPPTPPADSARRPLHAVQISSKSKKGLQGESNPDLTTKPRLRPRRRHPRRTHRALGARPVINHASDVPTPPADTTRRLRPPVPPRLKRLMRRTAVFGTAPLPVSLAKLGISTASRQLS